MDERKVKAFLIELTALSKKYDLVIRGCGCCGSPWIEEDSTKNGFYITVTTLENDFADKIDFVQNNSHEYYSRQKEAGEREHTFIEGRQ